MGMTPDFAESAEGKKAQAHISPRKSVLATNSVSDVMSAVSKRAVMSYVGNSGADNADLSLHARLEQRYMRDVANCSALVPKEILNRISVDDMDSLRRINRTDLDQYPAMLLVARALNLLLAALAKIEATSESARRSFKAHISNEDQSTTVISKVAIL